MTITPEERATKLVATSLNDWCGDNGDQKPHGLYLGQMILEIAAAIREAVEAEREGCAKFCDIIRYERYGNPTQFGFDDDEARGAYHCGSAIRQRGAK